MSLLEEYDFDSLAYLDKDYDDPIIKSKVDDLILNEMKTFKPKNYLLYLPHPLHNNNNNSSNNNINEIETEFVFTSDLVQHDYNRMTASTDAGIGREVNFQFKGRYFDDIDHLQPPPSSSSPSTSKGSTDDTNDDDKSLLEWKNSLKKIIVRMENNSNSILNLKALDTHGSACSLFYNEYLKNYNDSINRRVKDTEEASTEVNVSRLRESNQAGEELLRLKRRRNEVYNRSVHIKRNLCSQGDTANDNL